MFTETQRYQLDHTGINPDNYISGEIHTLSTLGIRTISPMYGSFFSDSLVVYDFILNNLLVKNIDYKLAELDQEATLKYGKEIYKLIVIINSLVTDKVRINYNALASIDQQSIHNAITLYEEITVDDRDLLYQNIANKPSEFPPSLHKHLLSDLVGFDPLVTSLERVRKAMILKDIPTLQTIANWVKTKYGDNSYSIYASSNNVNRGSSININLLTDVLPDNTTLYWTIEHVTTNASDFVATNGTINVVNNSGIFNIAIPPSALLENNETFKVNVRETDIAGNILISTQEITINGIFSLSTVNAPTISSPVNNSITQNVNVAFISSAFAVTGGTDTHQGSDWQVATDLAFTNIVHQVVNSFDNKTSWTHPTLGYATVYYLRVRHKGVVYGYSNWSNTIKFTTKLSGTVNTPTLVNITPSNTSINPTINTSVLAMSEGTDTHLSTDWEIATDSAFNNKVRTSINNTVNKTSWTPSPNLSNSTTYYLRFRYKATIAGYSNWSATTVITTASAAIVNVPIISSIMQTWDSSSRPLVTIGTNAISFSGGTDTHHSSDWQISLNSGFSSLVAQSLNDIVNKVSWSPGVPLAFSQTYWVRVRHRSNVIGVSGWTVSSFVSNPIYTIVQPTIILPLNNITMYPRYHEAFDAVGITFDLKGGDFDIIGGNNIGKHIETDYEIYTTPDFSVIVANGILTLPNANPTQFLSIFLNGHNKTYYIRIHYKDANVGESIASLARIITVPDISDPGNPFPVITEPVITSPVNSSLIDRTASVTSSAFAQSPGTATTHLSSDWQISTNPSFTTIFDQSINDTINKTSWVIGNTVPLVVSTNYYLRVRYKGVNGTYSSWSNTIQVITKSVFIPMLETAIIPFTDNVSENVLPLVTDLNSDGSKIIIGAPYEVIFNNGFMGYESDAGAAYIHTRVDNTWTQQTKIVPGDVVAGDRFGYKVSMDSAGTRVAISCYYKTIAGVIEAGCVYIYRYESNIWVQEAILTASDKAPQDWFGSSIDMNPAGTVIAIGAYGRDTDGLFNSGAVYIFNRSGTAWTQESIISANTDYLTAYFGNSVSMNDAADRIIIGAFERDTNGLANSGAAYIFRKDPGPVWVEEAVLIADTVATESKFGHSVSMDSIGTRVAIESTYFDSLNNNKVLVYVFTRSGTAWTKEASFNTTDTLTLDSYGAEYRNTVIINKLGNVIIIGMHGKTNTHISDGVVYIFTRSGNVWTQSARLTGSTSTFFTAFGTNVSLSEDSKILAISNLTTNGSVYIFR